MHKPLRVSILIACLFLSLPLQATVPSQLPAYEAQYKVYWHGMKVGNSYHTLHKQNPKTYRLEVLTKALYGIPYSLFEQSEFIIDKNLHIISRNYQYNFKEGLKRRKGDVEFNEQSTYSGRINGKRVEVKHDTPLLDNLNFIIQLQLYLKQANRNITEKSFTVFDKGKIRQYEFNIAHDELIQTELGKLMATKVSYRTPDGRHTTSFWLAKDKHYLPIKMVQTKLNRTISYAEINKVKFSP